MKRVLVIEDDHNMRVTMRQTLEAYGYSVQSATNGKDALDYLRRSVEKPDLILLDIMMPLMSGWEFIKEQRKDAALSSIPVVIVTASEGVQGATLPARALIQKPFELTTLMTVVRKLCGGPNSDLAAGNG